MLRATLLKYPDTGSPEEDIAVRLRLRGALSVAVPALIAALWLVLAPAAHAADGPTLSGQLSAPDGGPVTGVTLTIAGGGFTGAATSGADGTFTLTLPKTGAYEVAVDLATLPEGLTLGRASDEVRKVNVISDKRIVYRLVKGTAPPAEAASPGAAAADAPTTGATEPAPTGGSKADLVAQLLVDGLLLGIVIALGALGLNLIFGTTGLTNFSHGELLTLGAFTAYFLNQLGLNIIIAAPIAVVVSALVFGWGQNRVLWRNLRRRRTGLIPSMIVTIGLAIVLRYTVQLVFGGQSRTYLQYAAQPGLEFGPVSITPKAIILAAIAIVLLAATVIWLGNSRVGKATRAVSDNPALASATGIDVERVIAVVWTIGAGLAAYAGIYLGMTQDVQWNMGQRLLLVMFAAVVLGGLGTIYGALLGAMLVGLFIQLSTLVIPPEMKTVGALFVMVIILLIRPQGLLGRRERVG